MRSFVRFLQDEDAATSVEYAVMLALIIMAVLAAIGAVGSKSGGLWSGIVNNLAATDSPGP